MRGYLCITVRLVGLWLHQLRPQALFMRRSTKLFSASRARVACPVSSCAHALGETLGSHQASGLQNAGPHGQCHLRSPLGSTHVAISRGRSQAVPRLASKPGCCQETGCQGTLSSLSPTDAYDLKPFLTS